jgi:hypothetical protein
MSTTNINIEELLAQIVVMQQKITTLEQEIIALKSPTKTTYYMPSYNVDFSKINYKEQCYY